MHHPFHISPSKQSDDVTQGDIPTLIRFFSQTTRSEIYQPNVFIYTWGSFLTAMHCPEAAQPTVIFLGTVCEHGGQLNNGFGLTKENQQLAIMTEDVHFLPAPPQPLPPTPSSTLGKRKRTDRWTQRATSSTPSKSAHQLDYYSSPHHSRPDEAIE
ncbi:hypothetical protein BDV41DRAFT_583453 [Aspergillus transmontanensis]|uniref:Uncharacterized protein n=1 Tax=Aspergillus transmontanensis TaxID=1034304 RepID=A0A5N6VDP5_9EURO|nr:hypothetical protein BDV41DRAFT_583453 [Aspergillus transmontanensis]